MSSFIVILESYIWKIYLKILICIFLVILFPCKTFHNFFLTKFLTSRTYTVLKNESMLIFRFFSFHSFLVSFIYRFLEHTEIDHYSEVLDDIFFCKLNKKYTFDNSKMFISHIIFHSCCHPNMSISSKYYLLVIISIACQES